jgi:hypothetical protein
MPTRTDQAGTGGSGQRQRNRLREVFTGKTIGFTSIAAPMIGYVINDLRKPDSIVRRLISGAVRKLLPPKSDKLEAIDITDKVEILEDASDRKSVDGLAKKRERS